MTLVIIIARGDLDNYPELHFQLLNLSTNVKDGGNDHIIYYPLSGQLVKFVNLLKQYRVLYELKMQRINPDDQPHLSS